MSGALNVAEDIRANVENEVIVCPDGEVTKVTISIGVNTKDPNTNCSIDNFISGADSALYTAKGRGRNRVCRYEGNPC